MKWPILTLLASALTGGALDVTLAAEVYPSRPVQVIVPLTAGSVIDLLARALSEAMAKANPQTTFMVLNREGASGVIGTSLIARAKPDGYTLGFGGDSTVSVQPHVVKDIAYSIDSFDFICQVVDAPLMFVVGPNSPYQSLEELVEAARKLPKPLAYGTTGHASTPHLLGESVARESGVKFVHIPFRSVADMNTQTINGSVDFTITLPNILTLGRGVRALAVSADEPMTALPMIPPLKALGWQKSAFSTIHLLYAPRGLPPEALRWLRNACAEAVSSTTFHAMTVRTHTVPRHSDSESLNAWMRQAHQSHGERVRRIEMQSEQVGR
ncbi:MAG: tripartite tricarboxylate transporter substrate binding protein [Burkholderiales bacterium]